ncbi:MAG TPA: trimeric intracellular cation channel family protein [Solirubrobacteraceae bacterium]|nr:trimeric intracellular cation channel family protein [Solirubrobacteraceae bacterium]
MNLANPPRVSTSSLVPGVNATLLLILSLIGVFVFGLSGGMAGVRARLDLFGAMLLAVVVGIAGGTIRDLLIGVPPATFRDWRYLAVAGGAGLIAPFAHPAISRLRSWIDGLDAAGLGLFCVVGAETALANRLGSADCVILGAITGIGGGMLRDILVREIPAVLRGGFYAIPALCGAGIVVTAYRTGDHTIIAPIGGAVVCFLMRIAGIRYGLGLPSAAAVAEAGPRALFPVAGAEHRHPAVEPGPDASAGEADPPDPPPTG